MANIPFKSITFPGLPNKYTVPEISNDLMTAGKAADAKATGDALSALEDAVTEETDKLKADLDALEPGLSQEAKAALLACFDHVYWSDDNGDTHYQALHDALYPASGLVSITAVFAPGTATIYSDDNLNTLKAYLTVTGLYENGQSKAITDYALSGSLSVGTNTITVSCDGVTTTFSVTVASTLDRIAYGTLTYRDIFKTGNYFSLEGFEGIDEVPSVETALPNGDTFYGSYGSPAPFISSDYANKGVHSIRASGSGSSQAKYTTSRMPTSGRVLLACSVYVDRYTAGVCGVQFNIKTDSSHAVTKAASVSRATDGFEQIVTINDYDVSNGQSTALAESFVGTWSRADADAYVDDVVIAIVPSEMTLETATTLYNNYISMI